MLANPLLCFIPTGGRYALVLRQSLRKTPRPTLINSEKLANYPSPFSNPEIFFVTIVEVSIFENDLFWTKKKLLLSLEVLDNPRQLVFVKITARITNRLFFKVYKFFSAEDCSEFLITPFPIDSHSTQWIKSVSNRRSLESSQLWFRVSFRSQTSLSLANALNSWIND